MQGPKASIFPATILGSGAHTSALRALTVCVALGVLTYALALDAPVGLGWLVLQAILVPTVVVAFGRPGHRFDAPSWILGACALSFSAALVYRASAWTLAVAFPASLFTLMLLFLVAARDTSQPLAQRVGHRFLAVARRSPDAIGEAKEIAHMATQGIGRVQIASAAKGLALGFPIAGVLAWLLAADPAFARALFHGVSRSATSVRVVMGSAICASLYLFLFALGRRRAPQESAITFLAPYRFPEPDIQPDAVVSPSRRAVRPLTWAVVLLQVTCVFGVFAAVHAKDLFGGHGLARAPGTVTYAHYLHAGFAQLSVAAALGLVVILAGHRLMRRGDAQAARVPGGVALIGLELVVLVLIGVALLSCWQRLHIYEEAYGFTYLRLGVAFFQVGIFGTLLVTMAACVFRAWRGWLLAHAVWTLALLTCASWMNADLYLANGHATRIERAEQGLGTGYEWRELDVAYLAGLSRDAAPVLAHPLLLANPAARRELENAWQEREHARGDRGWRAFRGHASHP